VELFGILLDFVPITEKTRPNFMEGSATEVGWYQFMREKLGAVEKRLEEMVAEDKGNIRKKALLKHFQKEFMHKDEDED
jgi:hypothetical protein